MCAKIESKLACSVPDTLKTPDSIMYKDKPAKHMVSLIKDAINFVCDCDLRSTNKSALNENFIASVNNNDLDLFYNGFYYILQHL